MKISRVERISSIAPIQRITPVKRVKRIKKKITEIRDERMGKYVDISVEGPITGNENSYSIIFY
jgi:hypothetical protein